MNSLISKTMHHVLLLPLIMALLLTTSTCSDNSSANPKCAASSCGNIRNIGLPFQLKGNSNSCGDPKYELTCENNHTVLYLYDGRYYVHSIDYWSDTAGRIRVVDDGLQKDNHSSLPHYLLTCSNFSSNDPYQCYDFAASSVSILNCSNPATSPSYVTTTKTAHNSSSKASRTNNHNLYAVVKANASDVEDFCTIYTTVPVRFLEAEEENRRRSYDLIHEMMVDGFYLTYGFSSDNRRRVFLCDFGLQYIPKYREWCGYLDYFPGLIQIQSEVAALDLAIFFAHFLVAKFIVGAPFVLIFLNYKWRRRHLATDANIEEFLQANNNFLPIRYSYTDIKKMTKNFKHKIGEGGYGSVYKGKLRSGSEVAIKVLKKSKENGQDFINEVATIGRIYHINIVQLIGFCIEGSKQALVYHFMPNGSLDKHIFGKVDNALLDCGKIYEIALGVTRGIEYLHRGCDIQILHFDIKPHNILLDENFTPRVSDFGLARLYPTNRNIVTLTTIRGTLGYMAPELFYKDLGGISYKADVYSFGMLLMELAGRRKNFTTNPEQSSQNYFPQWIYDQLNKGEALELEEVMEEERGMRKKMIIIALWCIQLNPSNRPSMRKVINMLEEDIDELQMPPKPLLYPTNPTPIAGNSETYIELETFSSSSSAPLIATSTCG